MRNCNKTPANYDRATNLFLKQLKYKHRTLHSNNLAKKKCKKSIKYHDVLLIVSFAK